MLVVCVVVVHGVQDLYNDNVRRPDALNIRCWDRSHTANCAFVDDSIDCGVVVRVVSIDASLLLDSVNCEDDRDKAQPRSPRTLPVCE